MARTLLRQSVTVASVLSLTAATFFGVGLWRRSGDAKWCERAAAGGVAGEGRPPAADVLEQVRSACTVQRRHQRMMFGAVWRTGGQDTARCGFELARLQLLSYGDPGGWRALLGPYGLNDPSFEISSRADQDRFVTACLAYRGQDAG